MSMLVCRLVHRRTIQRRERQASFQRASAREVARLGALLKKYWDCECSVLVARALARVGGTRAIRQLLPHFLCYGGHPRKRQAVEQALADIGDVGPLVEALPNAIGAGHAPDVIRLIARVALVNPDAEVKLGSLLGSSDSRVKRFAIEGSGDVPRLAERRAAALREERESEMRLRTAREREQADRVAKCTHYLRLVGARDEDDCASYHCVNCDAWISIERAEELSRTCVHAWQSLDTSISGDRYCMWCPRCGVRQPEIARP